MQNKTLRDVICFKAGDITFGVNFIYRLLMGCIMRVLIRFEPMRYVPFVKINKHTIQGMLYSFLKGTKYEELHRKKGFKFFSFSDIFPANDFYPGKKKTLIVSSPNYDLINTWYYQFRKSRYLYLSDEAFKIDEVKKLNLPLKNAFETGSPVVLYKDSENGTYISFKKNDDLRFFLSRLKENAVKKYNAFYDDEYEIEEPLFDVMQFRKEVVVNLKKDRDEFVIIGSIWKLMKKLYIDKDDKKFYKFIMDTGLGEKNSLGFGFVNPKKEGK